MDGLVPAHLKEPLSDLHPAARIMAALCDGFWSTGYRVTDSSRRVPESGKGVRYSSTGTANDQDHFRCVWHL